MATRPEVLQFLLEETRLDAAELEARASRAMRPAYWKRLCPTMSVGKRNANSRPTETTSPSARRRQQLAHDIDETGYCEIGPLLPDATVRRMRNAVRTIKDAGWPPVFAFVYDEFWTVWQLPSLAKTIAAALGAGYRMRPLLWCYYVHPVAGARGWPPHADGYGTPGLSVWIPLTDATLENGCIYVIPKNLIAPPFRTEDLLRADSVPIASVTQLMHGARALPARAGSVLVWDFDVIHWGGVVGRPTHPRISISAEFVNAAEGARDDAATRSIAAGSVPSFVERLAVIARCIGLFGANDAWTFKYQDLGRRLADALNATHPSAG